MQYIYIYIYGCQEQRLQVQEGLLPGAGRARAEDGARPRAPAARGATCKLRKGTRSSSASFLAVAASAGVAAAAGRAGRPGARPGRPARCRPPACNAPPRQWRPGPRRRRRLPPCQGPGPGCRPLAGLPAGCGGLQAAAARWCASMLTGWHLRVSALGQAAGAAAADMGSDGAALLGLSNKSRQVNATWCIVTVQTLVVHDAGLEQAGSQVPPRCTYAARSRSHSPARQGLHLTELAPSYSAAGWTMRVQAGC